MSRTSRFVSIGVAVVIAVVAVVLLRPDSGSDEADNPPTQQPQSSQEDSAGKSASEPTATAEAAPEPPPVEVSVRNFKVAGGVKRIEAEKGDTVRLLVRSDADDEIHVHGYELKKAVSPRKPARFVFQAKLEGEYEIEAHEAEHQGLDPLIARLVVTPG
jgi:FtsP/CotA-like multicopper oxidase with cupredoxin domain